ncbi:MAG: hypothetical protein EOO38_06460 [Cytophagaceae bacterium]|nr:MAG: hypothetical protein EOO38_06460 [Cytophagaceae bacterium]
MTLEESQTLLAVDTHYQAIRAARERELSKIADQRKREQRPLLKELATAGVTVNWVGGLSAITSLDSRVYAVLLDHITKPYSPYLLELIGRAFGHRLDRPIVWDALINLLKAHALDSHAVEGVMAAISMIARPSDLHTLIDLLSDPLLGPNRIYLVSNLMRSKRPEARSALVRYQSDPDLTKEITFRLSRSRN